MQVDQTTWVKCINPLKHSPPKLTLQETDDQCSSSPVTELNLVAEPARPEGSANASGRSNTRCVTAPPDEEAVPL